MLRLNSNLVRVKKLTLLVILLGLVFFVTPVYAQTEDRILEFKSEVVVNKDTTIDVLETITFQPSSYSERHGIEWRYPFEYFAKGFKRPTEFKINEIYYYPLSNPNLKFVNRYSRENENGWANVRIGDPNILINEVNVYVIDYQLKYSSISYFDTHEEIYFNVIGPGWSMPIDNAVASITAPTQISESICYTGLDGVTEKECSIDIKGNKLTVSPDKTLEPYEAYTIAIKQPVGTFDDTRKEQAISIILANLVALIPIPLSIFLFGFLKKFAKNEKLTVIPEYTPPDGMDALSSKLLLGTTYKPKDISALLVQLAIKGYYKIREYEDGKYEFVKQEKDFSSEPKHIKSLLDSIFAYGEVIPLSKLVNFYTISSRILIEAKSNLKSLGYYSPKRQTFKTVFSILGVGMFFLLPVAINLNLQFFLPTLIGFGISGIVFFIFSTTIETRSKEGNKMYHKLLGLKMYINTAEKERIKFHNNPKKYKGIFEKLLPYAMIFNLEKQWSEEFKDIYTSQPDWYEGDITAFNTVYLSNSLGSFSRNVSTTATPPSYSSSGGYRSSGWSSGGSGFGGGGSSGGGGGGSGGGGW